MTLTVELEGYRIKPRIGMQSLCHHAHHIYHVNIDLRWVRVGGLGGSSPPHPLPPPPPLKKAAKDSCFHLILPTSQ